MILRLNRLRVLVPILVLGLCASCAPPPRAPATAESAFDVIELTIPQAHQAIETNFISCEGLTRRYLKRIEAYDQPTGLNAIIHINPNAIERSRKLDEQFAETGRMRRLHCIPLILKDNFRHPDLARAHCSNPSAVKPA